MAKGRLAASRPGVTRADLDAVLSMLAAHYRQLEQCRKDLDIQFQRIAQIQAELDHLRAAQEQRPTPAVAAPPTPAAPPPTREASQSASVDLARPRR